MRDTAPERPDLIPMAVGLLALLLGPAARAGEDRPIDFNRDVRPILSDRCYTCHGPDKNRRKADLRLDTRGGLLADRKEAGPIVVPRKPRESELLERVASTGDDRMPPEKSGKPLSAGEIATLKRWVEQGADWKGHWAYLPSSRSAVSVGDVHPIDRYLDARLREVGVVPSPEADRIALIRRVSFDLIGLPPSKAEVDAFLDDKSPDAFEKVVDRLLASPHYGERMAVAWLDIVRFADSIGYHSDNPMNVAPYRDYVIRSFNANKPFDRFTIEQIAGDLVPDASVETRVASGYNRLLQTTEEGGAQAKEYIAKYAADRVRNASTTWLGATMGCAECHDHKYDPFSQKDFYAFAAFFADVQEAAVGRRELGMPVPDPAQEAEIARLDAQIAAKQAEIDADSPERDAARRVWESTVGREVPWTVLDAEPARITAGSTYVKGPDGSLKATGKVESKVKLVLTTRPSKELGDAGVTGFRLEALDDPELPAGGPGSAYNGNFVLTEFVAESFSGDEAKGIPIKFRAAVADHEQDGYRVVHAIDGKPGTGWAILPAVGKPHSAVFEAESPVSVKDASKIVITLEFQSPFPQHSIGKLRLSATSTPRPAGTPLSGEVKEALAIAPEKRNASQAARIHAAFRAESPLFATLHAEAAALRQKKEKFVDSLPKSLVSQSGSPRVTRLLPRGNWMDDSGPVVEPAVPGFLSPISVSDRRPDRLDLAKWIVSRDNPMTARVFVNRLWAMEFGQGLSKVLDDLGSQGEWPTHPELLDWLASEFVESGWDVKHMVRLMVTSRAYRRNSHPRADLAEIDPGNRLLARQSSRRLDAEFVRDNALAISGLLSLKIGGPSVKPYQPAGYWDALNFPPRTYEADHGESQYRRGLYTHRQRTFPHPSLNAFDAPSREECTAERTRSNIPQQALVLLDDPSYVEAARAFAEHILKDGGPTTPDRLAWAFGRSLSRTPTEEEVKLLSGLVEKHLGEYRKDEAAAKALIAVGDHPAANGLDAAELAAWTSVARVLLNLHETITRP